MTNYSRSVLKSNGLHRPENLPVRFSFSLKIVPATIAKKLPLQLRPKPLFIASINFSHKRRNVRFKGLRRVHTRLSEKDRTQGLTRRNRGRFGRGWYHYSQSVPHVHQHPRAGYQNGKFCRFWVLVGGTPKERKEPSGQRCAYARRCSEASRPRWAALLCLQFGDIAVFFALCAVLSERARWGWYHYPRSVSHGSETLRGQGVERQTLPLLGLGRRRS